MLLPLAPAAERTAITETCVSTNASSKLESQSCCFQLERNLVLEGQQYVYLHLLMTHARDAPAAPGGDPAGSTVSSHQVQFRGLKSHVRTAAHCGSILTVKYVPGRP